MAQIIRGKRKGEEVEIAQFCNDWISTEDNVILNPLSVQLDVDEIANVRQSERAGQCGHMFMLYDLSDDGRFTKRERGS